MEVSVYWFSCWAASVAGGGLCWGLEGLLSAMKMDCDDFARSVSLAGDGEEGGEDRAGAEHLRSGDRAGGARVLLLFR